MAADVGFAVAWIESEILAWQFRHLGSWILFPFVNANFLCDFENVPYWRVQI
jgi:hypothetical protein